MEIWKEIPGLSGYFASSLGRIKNTNARKGSRAAINGGILAGWVQTVRPGYRRQLHAFRVNEKTIIKKTHRVILEAFVGVCPEGMECLHRNGDSLDNRLINLDWGTRSENVKDSIKHGTKTNPPVHSGITHHNATLTFEQVLEIRNYPHKHGTDSMLARRFGTSNQTIRRIRLGICRADS